MLSLGRWHWGHSRWPTGPLLAPTYFWPITHLNYGYLIFVYSLLIERLFSALKDFEDHWGKAVKTQVHRLVFWCMDLISDMFIRRRAGRSSALWSVQWGAEYSSVLWQDQVFSAELEMEHENQVAMSSKSKETLPCRQVLWQRILCLLSSGCYGGVKEGVVFAGKCRRIPYYRKGGGKKDREACSHGMPSRVPKTVPRGLNTGCGMGGVEPVQWISFSESGKLSTLDFVLLGTQASQIAQW